MNDLQNLLEEFLGNVREHGLKVLAAALFAAGGWLIGQWRARAKWRRREFLDRINVSLNMLTDGKLQIRTNLEKPCEEVFLNSSAVDAVLAAAKRTTATDPILPLAKDEYWYYLNAVLNDVAEKFSLGQIRRDMSLPTKTGKYLLCLTYECAGEIRTRKIRAMLIRKELLLALPQTKPNFESPHHITRWETLNVMQRSWEKSPHQFLEVELCVAD